MEVSKFFNNNDCYFYGHGTGDSSTISGPTKTTEGIFKNGLSCSQKCPSIYWTSICLGEGSEDLYTTNRELLDNWPHKGSTKVVIAAVPKEYCFTPYHVGGLYYNHTEAPYTYEYQDENGNKTFYLMPEFVKGFYDATNHTFVPNDKFYTNMNKKGRNELFAKVKQNYIYFLKDFIQRGILYYKSFAQLKDTLKEVNMDFPLTDEEIAELDKNLTFTEVKNSSSNVTNTNTSNDEEFDDDLTVSDDDWII